MGDEATGTPDGIDAPGVEAWFAANVPGAEPPLDFERIAGGHSNLTYRVTDSGGRRWALRRPAARQAARLRPRHGARAPGRLGARRDPGSGRAGRRPLRGRERQRRPLLRDGVRRGPRPARPGRGRDLPRPRPTGGRSRERVVDTLVDIHAVDPDAAGLGELGRKEDYVARQLHRWQGQWEKSKTRELPLVDEVHERLAARDSRAGPGDDRPRRLPARQHDPHRRRARSPRLSTGSSARSATRSPTSAC